MPPGSTNPFARTSPASQTSAPLALEPDPILGAHLEATGAVGPSGVARPEPPYIGLRDFDEGPDVFWLGAHGGAGISTVKMIGAQREITGITTRRWPRLACGTRAPVVVVARTHAVGLWHAQRVVQEWASGMVEEFVDLHGLLLLADAPGGPAKELRGQIESVSALVPLTWSIGWHPRWRTIAPGSRYPVDMRTKRTLGAIRRSLSTKQAA